jgi:hypothetical protein
MRRRPVVAHALGMRGQVIPSKGCLALALVPGLSFCIACATRFPGRYFCLPDPVAQSVQFAELKIEVGCVVEED